MFQLKDAKMTPKKLSFSLNNVEIKLKKTNLFLHSKHFSTCSIVIASPNGLSETKKNWRKHEQLVNTVLNIASAHCVAAMWSRKQSMRL